MEPRVGEGGGTAKYTYTRSVIAIFQAFHLEAMVYYYFSWVGNATDNLLS